MNRQERREQIRKYAKFKDSEQCPLCNKKSRFISIPTKDYLCDIKCELCNGIVYKDVNAIPMIYVNLHELEENKP